MTVSRPRRRPWHRPHARSFSLPTTDQGPTTCVTDASREFRRRGSNRSEVPGAPTRLRRRVGVALLVLLAVASGSRAQAPRAGVSGTAPGAMAAPSFPGTPDAARIAGWWQEPLPRRDYAEMFLDSARPASRWQESERRDFESALRDRGYRWLVAPIQVQGYGVDRVTRALWHAELVRALGVSAAPAAPVDRALGEGRRRLGDELPRLAGALGATHLLEIHVGHDGEGRLFVSASTSEAGAGRVQRRLGLRHWTDSAFPNGTPPIVALRRLLPEIVALTRSPNPPAVAADHAAKMPDVIPDAPGLFDALTSAPPLHRAAALAWFASLVPAMHDRTRQRLYIQALDVLDRAGIESEDGRCLRALAYLRLEMRPLALATLVGLTGPTATALQELAAGNLPEFEGALGRIESPLFRAMLTIELGDLRAAYRVPARDEHRAAIGSVIASMPAWGPLLAARHDDNDAWRAGAGFPVKLLLDDVFPLRDFGAQEVVRRTTDRHGPGLEAAIAVASIEHVRRVRADDRVLKDCISGSPSCPPAALLDLLESRAVADACATLYRAYALRGIREEAIAWHSALDVALSGHPDWLVAAGFFHHDQSEQGTAADREASRSRARALAVAAARLEQGQTRTASAAIALLETPSPDSIPFLQGYGRDRPTRPYWPPISWSDEPSVVQQAQLEALAYAERSAVPLFILGALSTSSRRNDDSLKTAIDQALANRFHGSPARASVSAARGDPPASDPLDAWNQRLRERPDDWEARVAIARHRMENDGDYAAAERVLEAYPDFASGAVVDSRVGLSNAAASAGHGFFWVGETERARKFYLIAAGSRTGSHAEMMASTRLALMDGRWTDYEASNLRRIERYDDEYAWRDLLMHRLATERAAGVWSDIDRLLVAQPSLPVWQAADAAHRAEGRAWPEIRRWMADPMRRRAGEPNAPFPMVAAITINAVDRRPSPDLPALLREIEMSPKPVTETTPGQVALPGPEGRLTILQRAAFREDARGRWDGDRVVAHPLVAFAEAYQALREGRSAEAVRGFDAMAAFYPIDGRESWTFDTYSYLPFALGYFAMASADSGDPLKLEAYLAALPKAKWTYDHHLALAVFQSLRPQTRTAGVARLEEALRRRVWGDFRPIPTEYQWPETCEWLFERTGDRTFADLALRWARTYARLQPAIAWPHAMIAKHTDDVTERLRELGIALTLDPLSERASAFPESQRTIALSAFAAGRAFMQNRR